MASFQDCGPLRPVRLLSLDGGGIRGISELTILAEIMHRVKVEQQLDVVPLPADYFDMICGTSTGGLIAILLGRLRFSVAEAIEQYGVFAEKVFSSRKIKGQDGSFKASRLEEVIKEVICKKLGEGHEEEKMYESEAGESECKTFVCAASAKSLKSSPRLFRTWVSNINPSENCTIWEACRATTAAPTFFKSIRIGRPGVQEEFVDAGLGCNNPVKQLLLEACQEFGKARPVSCIVSIGTGKARVIRLNKPRGLDRWIHRDLVGALAKMATDSEEVAREMERRFEDRKGPYFRLNVDQGLEDITMEDWEKLGEVATHTKNYIVDNGSARAAVERIVAALVGKPLEMYQLGQLDGSISKQHTDTDERTLFDYPSSRVKHFVHRKEQYDRLMSQFSMPRTGTDSRVVCLVGMGGCGKSQLAMDFCQKLEAAKQASAIVWVNASSNSSVEQKYAVVAGQMTATEIDTSQSEKNIEVVKEGLRSWPSAWVLVFDNFDDPDAFIERDVTDYFPRSSRGFIILTSRNLGLHRLGDMIQMSTMNPEEALSLLVRSSAVGLGDGNAADAEQVVKSLGHLALALDQAGAYIYKRRISFDEFLKHFHNRWEIISNEVPRIWSYENPQDRSKLTVATTWELSLDLITGDDDARCSKERLLTLAAFLDCRHVSERLFQAYLCQDNPLAPDQYVFKRQVEQLRNSFSYYFLRATTKKWLDQMRDAADHHSYVSSHTDETVEYTTVDMLVPLLTTGERIWDTYSFRDIIAEMHELSLIESFESRDSATYFSLHPLIQEWMKLRLSIDERKDRFTDATVLLQAYVERQARTPTDFEEKSAILSHIHTILEELAALSIQPMIDGGLCEIWTALAKFCADQGQYSTAENLYQQLLATEEDKCYVDICLFALQTQIRLGNLYLNQKRLSEAEVLFERLAETLEKNTSISSSEIYESERLSVTGSLARLYSEQGQVEESERLSRQNLQRAEKQLGPDHPTTVKVMHNLAVVRLATQTAEQSLLEFQQVVARTMRVLGATHLTTIGALHMTARQHRMLGQWADAEELAERVFAEMLRQLGPTHPQTLGTMQSLRMVYSRYGKEPGSGVPFYAIKISGFVPPGASDPKIAVEKLALLARAYGDLEMFVEAISIFRDVLRWRVTHQGPTHPATLNSMFALATHYPKVERYGDAIRLLDELQTKLVQCPGLLTPSIEEVEENLAANRVAQEHHSTSNDTTELDGNLDGTHILWFDGAPPPGLLVPASTHTFK